MKNWMKILVGLFVLGIVGAGLGYKFIYNKPHTNYEKATPDYQLAAKDLFEAYRSVSADADEKYTGKVLQIAGTLSKVEKPDSLTIAVFVLDEGMFGDEGIRCTMLEIHSSSINKWIGSEISLKGYCTGYNDTDVILEHCSIVKL